MLVTGNQIIFYIILSVGPLLVVLDVQSNGKITESIEIPFWGLAFGAGSFIAGIFAVMLISYYYFNRLVDVQWKQLAQA